MINSRNKGAFAEREVAGILREHGYDARRGVQYSGANGDADVVGLPGVHLEVKRRERLDLYDSMDQAKRDAREGEIPVVLHRRNHKKWVAIMELENFLQMYKEAEHGIDD